MGDGVAGGAVPHELEHTVRLHAAHYASLLEHEGPRLRGDGTPSGQLHALRRLQAELDNLAESVDSALRRRQMQWLEAHATHSWRLYDLLSEYAVTRDRYTAILDSAHASGDAWLIQVALFGLARALDCLGQLDQAQPYLDELREFEALTGRPSPVPALVLLGGLKAKYGDFTEARRILNGCLASTSSQHFDSATTALIQRSIGNIEANGGDLVVGRKLLSASLATSRVLGDTQACGRALLGLAGLECFLGNVATAREYSEEARAIYAEIDQGRGYGTAHSIWCQAVVAQIEDDYPAYLKGLENAMEMLSAIGEQYGLAGAKLDSALAYYLLQDFESARHAFTEALRASSRLGLRRGTIVAILFCAGTLFALGHNRAAAVTFYGAQHCMLRSDQQFHVGDQSFIERMQTDLTAQVAKGQLEATGLEEARFIGESMELEELTDFALRALQG